MADGVLEHGQCFIQVSTPTLENCFFEHGPEFYEASGSDLYFVTWDENLIPPGRGAGNLYFVTWDENLIPPGRGAGNLWITHLLRLRNCHVQ
ncbi:hypothetical protein IFM89_008343 [Coptis chinensis]|uniref:Uncharacterized protein n=1 Tax=Coptis chinensis TaxID=261450 RepID=A0A835M7G1_9MAGN|nr:hypothetical protein IFM89_008343 [Coptis chinensis]